jgi:Protein of unknown function (DUF402)
VLADHDFHPDEPTVRVFRTADPGVLHLDDEVAVTEARYEGAILRHYAFGDRWYKINVTTDVEGSLIETGDANQRFAFNCDIATPMERDGKTTFAVDLFLDVLVRQDASSCVVVDEEEFEDMLELALFSPAEARGARAGLGGILAIIERRELIPWLDSIVPFGPGHPPPALAMLREPVPARLRPHIRSTW